MIRERPKQKVPGKYGGLAIGGTWPLLSPVEWGNFKRFCARRTEFRKLVKIQKTLISADDILTLAEIRISWRWATFYADYMSPYGNKKGE